MLEIVVSAVIKVLINKFQKLAISIFKSQMLKKGIRIKAEKAKEHIENGNQHLDNNNLEGWLNELNEENS